ncbi:hypothetical protein EVAR_48689_1 [Eumeta japonica]|uniref:Uncharacterized protein n=1 Tax=Eumeta variegata TaxID=151549 RepID=A0A4C1X9K5_EUMVA|nr:hypothetical protein EVAR_48689_1 [Eumeta japonica]
MPDTRSLFAAAGGARCGSAFRCVTTWYLLEYDLRYIQITDAIHIGSESPLEISTSSHNSSDGIDKNEQRADRGLIEFVTKPVYLVASLNLSTEGRIRSILRVNTGNALTTRSRILQRKSWNFKIPYLYSVSFEHDRGETKEQEHGKFWQKLLGTEPSTRQSDTDLAVF